MYTYCNECFFFPFSGQEELNPSSIESFLSKSTGGSTSQPETKSKKKNLKNEKMK